MIAVIFELQPKTDQSDRYFSVAASLKEELSSVEGFISVERFQSITTPGKYLSLSFWQDEAAVLEWRNRSAHRAAQALGRGELFSHYRLRVAHVLRDYGLTQRTEAPDDSSVFHGEFDQ